MGRRVKPSVRDLHAAYVASLRDADLANPADFTHNPTPSQWACIHGSYSHGHDTRWNMGPGDLDPDDNPIYPAEAT